jgi:hypothetical protein
LTHQSFVEWFSSNERLGYYAGVKVMRAVVSPLLYLAAAILVKVRSFPHVV